MFGTSDDVLFRLVLFAVHAVRFARVRLACLSRRQFLRLTDVDVLTISMAKSAEGQIPIQSLPRRLPSAYCPTQF